MSSISNVSHAQQQPVDAASLRAARRERPAGAPASPSKDSTTTRTPTDVNSSASAPSATTTSPAVQDRNDSVELSSNALGGARSAASTDGPEDGGAVRSALVARIRAEIAAGTYLTPDKLDRAASRIARVIEP